jgi:hypothetical protein
MFDVGLSYCVGGRFMERLVEKVKGILESAVQNDDKSRLLILNEFFSNISCLVEDEVLCMYLQPDSSPPLHLISCLVEDEVLCTYDPLPSPLPFISCLVEDKVLCDLELLTG